MSNTSSRDELLRVRFLRGIPIGTRGKYRLGRFLLGSTLDEAEALFRDRYGLSYQVPSLREPVAYAMLVDGVYERDELEFVIASLPAGATFVDVGANVGCYSLPVARHVGPSGKVVALEASPKIFRCLVGNIARNSLANILPYECAALDREGTTEFHEAPADHFGMGSIAPQFGALPIEVRSRRLDDILAEAGIGKVDLVKIDVEGYESRVLLGAQALLTSNEPPVIMFEFMDWSEDRAFPGRAGESQRVLEGFGYSVWRLDDYLAGRKPLGSILTSGIETLVAKRTPAKS